MSSRLNELRSQIDAADARIVGAVNERLDLVERLWRLKAELGIERLDPGREQEIRASLRAVSSGPLTDEGLDELVTALLTLTKREHSRLSGAPVADDRLDRNKGTVTAFYDLMFNQGKPQEAIERYAGDVYIQHNPGVGDGKDAFIDYFTRVGGRWPNKRVHFKRVLAEGDFVVLHCHQEWPPDQDWAGIDIFRLDESGKIVEHWDVLQVIPAEAQNDNTMF